MTTYYSGENNIAGSIGNLGALAGGIPLKNLFPNAPSDIPFIPNTPGIVRPATNQKLKDLFPYQPGGYGDEEGGPRYGTTPGGVAFNLGNPGDIAQVGPKRGSSPYAEPDRDLLENLDPFGKLKRNQQPTQNPPQPPIQLELPLAQGGVFSALGNAAGLAAAASQPPQGFQNKYVS